MVTGRPMNQLEAKKELRLWLKKSNPQLFAAPQMPSDVPKSERAQEQPCKGAFEKPGWIEAKALEPKFLTDPLREEEV